MDGPVVSDVNLARPAFSPLHFVHYQRFTRSQRRKGCKTHWMFRSGIVPFFGGFFYVSYAKIKVFNIKSPKDLYLLSKKAPLCQAEGETMLSERLPRREIANPL